MGFKTHVMIHLPLVRLRLVLDFFYPERKKQIILFYIWLTVLNISYN